MIRCDKSSRRVERFLSLEIKSFLIMFCAPAGHLGEGIRGETGQLSQHCKRLSPSRRADTRSRTITRVNCSLIGCFIKPIRSNITSRSHQKIPGLPNKLVSTVTAGRNWQHTTVNVYTVTVMALGFKPPKERTSRSQRARLS
ncbi:hypothetical protein RRG08_018852 [Elysia crispata]|uniref:Uncharacterized protein n=1 Tax=Elysia crispata TaxID=231223 RepID=A0AAE1B635_9GAST|nr:hypothetical protein RRG08_018852 [Elysia crispata]